MPSAEERVALDPRWNIPLIVAMPCWRRRRQQQFPLCNYDHGRHLAFATATVAGRCGGLVIFVVDKVHLHRTRLRLGAETAAGLIRYRVFL